MRRKREEGGRKGVGRERRGTKWQFLKGEEGRRGVGRQGEGGERGGEGWALLQHMKQGSKESLGSVGRVRG